MSATSERHLLHFDLKGRDAAYTFHVAQREYPIARHTPNTLSDARASNGFLHHLPDADLSHYADVALPADAVALMWVTEPVMIDGVQAERIVSMGIHVPREARLRDVRRNLHLLHAEEPHPKLAYRKAGQKLLHDQRLSLEAAPDQIAAVQDPYEIAVALLFQHPELINLNKDAATGGPVTVIEACIRRALSKSMILIDQIEAHLDDWSHPVRAMDGDLPAVDDKGDPVFVLELHPDVAAALPAVVQRALVLVKQSEELRNQSWSVEYGSTVADYAGSVRPKPHVMAEADTLRASGDVNWRLKNLTPSDGLQFEPDVRFVPAAPGKNWRADGVWSSEDDLAVGAFDDAAQKALAAQRLHLVFGPISGPLLPVAGKAGVYSVSLSAAGSSQRAHGECRLNAEGSALQFLVSTTDGPFDQTYFAIGTPGALKKVHAVLVRDGGSNGNLTVVVKNHWLRHLSAYVEFLDSAGRPKAPPNWTSRFPIPGTSFDDHPTLRYVDVVGPVETMMGIPLSADSSHLNVPVPVDAAVVRFVWGGLGQGRNDPVACPAGAVMTVVVEMALPIVMLVAGAGLTASGGLLKILREKPILGALLAAFTGFYIANDPAKAVTTIGKKLIPVVAKAGLGKLSEYIASKIMEGGAKKAIPFINVALFLADTAATVAQLAQTYNATRQSPRAHRTEITRSIDLRITITSSKVYKKFPDHHHHLGVVVAYDSGATLPKLVKALPKETISEDIVVEFKDVPAAGKLRVLVFFYAENDWQSGQGASDWMKAEGNSGGARLVVPPIEIAVNEVPLGHWSIYEHMQKIVLRDKRHVWQAGPPPQATKTTSWPIRGKIEKRHAITMAQYSQFVGYAWQATDLDLPPDDPTKPPTSASLFTLQNLSVLQHPQDRYGTPTVGTTASGGIAYDLVSPDDGSGRNFYLDPTRGVFDEDTNPTGGHHLRRVVLDYTYAPQFPMRGGDSFGRFPDAVDGMVVHPHGYVFAIRRGYHKIYRIELPDNGMADNEAPMSTLYSGEGKRVGLLSSPLAISLALDGRVLILEEGNNGRVQCFDVNGNPVAYFKDTATQKPTPILELRKNPNFSLLDMAVEAKGHIFILGHTGAGKLPGDYRLDLYDPSGAFLTSTPNFTAARITVDLLRNIFAMNYEVLDHASRRPEPGISQWRPPAPPKSQSEQS